MMQCMIKAWDGWVRGKYCCWEYTRDIGFAEAMLMVEKEVVMEVMILIGDTDGRKPAILQRMPDAEVIALSCKG